MMLWSDREQQVSMGQDSSSSHAAAFSTSACPADQMVSTLPCLKASWAASSTEKLYDHASLIECTRCAQGNYTSTLYGGGGSSSSGSMMMVDGGVGMMGEYDNEQDNYMMGMEWGGVAGDNMKMMKKRKLTSEQARQLEASFEADNKLEAEKKQRLAAELGLQPRQVAVWFQNRRARCKTKQLELDFLALKSDYDRVVAQRRHLQSEISRLAAQLQEKDSKTKMISCSQESTSSTNSNNGDLISERTTLCVKNNMDGFTSSFGNPNERIEESTTRLQDVPNSTHMSGYDWASYDSSLWVFD